MAAGGWAAYGSKLAEATAKTTTTATATTTTTAAKETAKEVAKERTSLWPAANGSKTVISGIEYTTHALERMQPIGTIMKGAEIFSRGVPLSVVENAIKWGKITSGNTAGEAVRTFGNIRVITNPAGTKVISVIKLGH
jgi:hypothetical protein